MTTTLSLLPSEAETLGRHEETIERGIATFIEVGSALLAIRDDRLYRATHDTFEDYCRERWNMGRARANQLVRAAGVIANLDTTVSKPETEAQARPLAPLPPEAQRQAWSKAVESSPNGKPTAKEVEVAAEAVAPRPKPTQSPAVLVEFGRPYVPAEGEIPWTEAAKLGGGLARPRVVVPGREPESFALTDKPAAPILPPDEPSASDRWTDVVTDTLKLITSFNRYGGMTKIAADWPVEKLRQRAEGFAKIIDEFGRFKAQVEDLIACRAEARP